MMMISMMIIMTPYDVDDVDDDDDDYHDQEPDIASAEVSHKQ